ncbi:MAG: hypothetical protein ACI3ZL_00960 [Candidatus Cryptobacteroides sp.]
MKPYLLILSLAVPALISSCSRPSVLPKDNWNPVVYEALTGMIAREGTMSETYDPQCRPYAVFDYDNTTIMNDISLTLMVYQIENLRYAFPPEDAFGCFTAWLPDLDKVLEGPEMSARMIGMDLAADYRALRNMLDEGMSLEMIHGTDEYLDFRAKLEGLNEGVENSFDYGTWCMWQPALFTGMSWDELQELTRESVDWWLAQGSIITQRWDSPDGRISVDVTTGLALPQESIRLYKTLKDNGFEVYVCSASLEAVVEAMACSPRYGLDLSPDNVFGIRLADADNFGGPFDENYDQTFLEGKTACIRKLIAPRHGGRAPSLVAGDSNGDYDMLTSFDSLGVGLIIDCKRSGPIARLAEKASTTTLQDCSTRPVYVLQQRDLSIPGYVSGAE